MVRSQRLQPYSPAGARSRIFVAPGLRTDGVSADVHLGVLPLSRFLNGHTYFVQHAHQLPGAPPPLSVHMTYQFAEGAKFAYGKRQRLREAGLWMVEEPSYYNGRYVTAAAGAANLPLQEFGPSVHSRAAVEMHLKEARHRSKVRASPDWLQIGTSKPGGVARSRGECRGVPQSAAECRGWPMAKGGVERHRAEDAWRPSRAPAP